MRRFSQLCITSATKVSRSTRVTYIAPAFNSKSLRFFSEDAHGEHYPPKDEVHNILYNTIK